MDQLKPALAVLGKHHFWVLCVLIVVANLGTWFMATSSMTKETKDRVTEINSSFDEGQAIQRVTNHPNDLSVKMMEELIGTEAEQVSKAWGRRFREQEDVLVWPSGLKSDFIDAVKDLIPIELTVEYPTPPEDELKIDYRNRYRDYIRSEMPKLAEIIGAEWHVSATAPSSGAGGYGGAGMGGDMGMGDDMGMGMGGDMGMGGMEGGYGGGYSGRAGAAVDEKPIVVEWSQQNQTQLQASSFNWVRPTTLQMLYAQENLWVLHALMLIIQSTNGDADAQYNAAIKEIMTIDLGPAALGIKAVGHVKTGQGGAMGGMGGEDYGMGAAGGAAAAGIASGGASNPYGQGVGISSGDPADNRYVDDKMEPLTGKRLRLAMETGSASDAFLVVAKRMPVRLRVRMDVRKLPLLLCECANSDLPVEVRQVRINPRGASGGGGEGGYGGMGGMDSMGEAGGGGMMMPGGMGGGGSDYGMDGSDGGMGMGMEGGFPGMGGGGMMGDVVESPFDATVEIYGLIYIYNPVDPAKLGLDDTEATDVAPAGARDAGTGEAVDQGTGATPDAGAASAGSATPAGTETPAAAETSPPSGAGAPATETGTPASVETPAGTAAATGATTTNNTP